MPFKSISEGDKWTLFQKKKLLRLLKEYPIDAYESIANQFCDKDAEQVETYLRRLKQEIRNKNKSISKDYFQRVPLEEWLEVSTDLVDYENVDCSANLLKVMSIISRFEDFQCAQLDKYCGPDYSSIYKFLAQILQPSHGEDLIHLEPLESAIMLDMIHSLMDVLSQHDVSLQRNVMKWKYQLMNYRYNKKCVPQLQQRASENDYKEFIDEIRLQKIQDGERETVYKTRRAGYVNQEESTKTGSTTSLQASEKALTQSTDNKTTTRCSDHLPGSSSFVDKTSVVRSDICHHKPGRKGANNPPETPRTEIVLVMPPKGVKIMNYEARGKKCQKPRMDGKYQPLNNEESLVGNDLNRDITYDMARSEVVRINPATIVHKKRQRDKEDEDKYNELLALHDEKSRQKPVKKPKLYSINPFCLPVCLIDLNFNKK